MDPNAPATGPQVDFCKALFRKTKLYYRTLTADRLIEEVRARTGFDLTALTASEAQAIITTLKKAVRYQRKSF